MRPLAPSDLDAIPRLGWVDQPTPVTSLARLADRRGLAFLGVKRDDLQPRFHGGSKPRKLDYILARAPFRDAPTWAAAGGIGSGALVALTGAARELGRTLEAHVFWTSLSDGVIENLAFTASGPSTIRYHGSRAALALRSPRLVLGGTTHGVPVIPAGGTSAVGMLGSVRAGLELAAQIREGELPEPERVYLPFGSGGSAVGLATGLALGGASCVVCAIAVVERPLSTDARVRGLQRALAEELARYRIAPPEKSPRLTLDHAHVGRGYAETTDEARAACEMLAREDVGLEPVYTGKAMAALLADARRLGLSRVLFWQTARRGPLPHDDDWRAKLPPALARRLADPASEGRRITRRRVLVGAAATALVGAGVRVTGYPPWPAWRGEVLAPWEAHVLHAAGEALAPHATADQLEAMPALVDRYLVSMPEAVAREIHEMLGLIEHGTTPLGARLHRFTRLSSADRAAYLDGLEARGGLLALAQRGLRDLCMLGLYQQSSTWREIGYDGPRVSLDYDPRGPGRTRWPVYDEAIAPAGTLPRAATR